MNRLCIKKRWPALVVGVCCVLFIQAAAMAQLAERQVFGLGTASTEGVAHPLGVTLAALVKLKLLPVSSIDVDARNTEGSKNNVDQLREADLDFAIVTGFDAYHAARGSGPFDGADVDSSLRFVTNLWTSTFYFIVRSEYAPTGTFQDFLNLQGRRVALGENGSDLRNQARSLFAALGVNIDEAYELADLTSASLEPSFLNGDIDGLLLVDDRQGADIAAFLEDAGAQAAVLSFEDDQIETAGGRDQLPWTQVVLPNTTLPGQSDEQVTIGMRNLLGTSERVADETVYQITKTVFDNLPFLQEMHSAAININLETALEQLSIPVHAGAANYYREVGVTVPEPEPIRISRLSQTNFLNRYGTIQEARTRLSDETFTVLGNQEGQTATRMISELAASLADTNIRVVGMTTPKPAENIADVLYARGVDSAIVPLNILNYARAQNIYPDMQRKIAYTTELFAEEVHLVVSDDIDQLDDLIGRPVNLGPPGSTSEFTASFLLDEVNVPVEPTYYDNRTALARLAKGGLAGAFIISGKPAPALSEIPADSGLRLLPLPELEGDAYLPATLAAGDYPNLIAANETVQTFSLRTMLLSYNWRSDNSRLQVLSTFIDAFFDRLPSLQQQDVGYHTKWQEINPFRDIEGWIRSPASESWLEEQGRSGETPVRTDDG